MAIIFSCDGVIKEITQIIDACYKLDTNLPPQSFQRNEVYRLLMLMNSRRAEYTAGGYFAINKTTLFQLLSVTTTYFILLVQFKDYL